ncbi:MAG: ParB/RepB/Spo0J family partition protein [Gammaproteobacteria bacterium]|nr:ParB/RepB/Spo0J family partition protein [Gammaproteobacteria bacterium]MCY4166315.1 ParB/RepB/Spo0J family partition protein [Gammaproteobacteria bacterium]MCY4254550.1 ParB/RepB/Spo0J family partition protein [Gammaproteobacteria bacterium]MCY4340262.1 ParB/RepB/Spo0J family partition protein [Gammaproteobacteria bacterium]
MASPNRGLGKGLDALLGPRQERGRPIPAGPSSRELKELPLDVLQPGRFQPRQMIDANSVAELAQSIRAQGLVQPLLARPLNAADGAAARYEIVAGERRWRAAQQAGFDRIPVVVRSLSDEEAAMAALVENAQRENLSAIELAEALRRILEISGGTHKDLAQSIGISRAAVSNYLRLLELGGTARALLAERKLEMGHARALLAVSNPARQSALARRIAEQSLSVRQAERLAQAESRPPAAVKPRDPNVVRLEQDLSERWGAPVRLQHGKRGGRLEIRYKSLDELDSLLARLK